MIEHLKTDPTIEQTLTLDEQVLLDACLRLRVAYDARGTFLIARSGIRDVLVDVASQGHKILGFDGFLLDRGGICPQMDRIFTSEDRSSEEILAAIDSWPDDPWPNNLWVDVVLQLAGEPTPSIAPAVKRTRLSRLLGRRGR